PDSAPSAAGDGGGDAASPLPPDPRLTLFDIAAAFESRRVPLNRPRLLPRAAHLHLGAGVIRDVEILATARDGSRAGSLAAAVDGTATPGGRRLLRAWLLAPLRDAGAIRSRSGAVAALAADRSAAARLDGALAGLPDLARLGGRVGGRRASPRELLSLARGCARLPDVRAAVGAVVEAAAGAGVADAGALGELWGELGDAALDEAAATVLGALVDPAPACLATFADYTVAADGAPPDTGGGGGGGGGGGDGGDADGRPGRTAILRDGVSADLDALRAAAAGAAAALRAYEATARAAVGVPGVKVRQVKNAGFALRVPRATGERLLAADAAHFSRHGWVLRGSTRGELRYVTPALSAIERDAAAAAAAVSGLEVRLYRQLRDAVGDLTPSVRAAAAAVAALDVLAGWASVATARGYTRPLILEGPVPTVELRALRHPVVERCLPPGVQFVPNDVRLGGGSGGPPSWASDDAGGGGGGAAATGGDGDAPPNGAPAAAAATAAAAAAAAASDRHLLMLTAANGAGKSVYLYSLAAAVVLAQAGCWVPASSARLTVTPALFTRVGAVDDVSGGGGGFQVEMAETAAICARARGGA
ncbi:hypothetical protein BU14_2484s0001, partial [Porphyra umbilicalis]